MLLRALTTYVRQAWKFRWSYPGKIGLKELVQRFPEWRASLSDTAGALKDECPWYSFAAIDFLRRSLTKDTRVYEYGSGGSTVFFARHVQEVISVEHDADWSHKVKKVLADHCLANVTLQFIAPEVDESLHKADPANPLHYVSSDERYKNHSFKAYASSIDRYPDGHFDLVAIDGRARPSCFHHAMTKVKPGGFLLLDNSDRAEYRYVLDYLAARPWRLYDFPGPTPYASAFARTSIWKRPCVN
jgi:hypothetical protein